MKHSLLFGQIGVGIFAVFALTTFSGCQFNAPADSSKSVMNSDVKSFREPAGIVEQPAPALEDPSGGERSGYATLDRCDLLVPDAPDVAPEMKQNPNWCKTHPKYKAQYDSARAGQEIWVKATAGNSRFHIYNYEQRLGVLIDWWKVLRSDQRYTDRFGKWGLMNDPDCCSPDNPGDCRKKFGREISREETHGFDYCPGDADLNQYVGNKSQKYQDPACRFQESNSDQLGKYKLPHSSCDLEFGTSTGIVGFRKFPNPRFDAEEWNRRSGGKGYAGISDAKLWDDHSIEPPYRVGMACAGCHIGFNPINPPVDQSQTTTFAAMKVPTWSNLLPNVGNQFARVSEIMASGMAKNSVEWQTFTHARPGTVDTSAQPNDFINNPGTFNAIYNVPQRPKFHHQVMNTYNREAGKFDDTPVTKDVYHILKGGEDSVGPEGSVQRVYINIGSCSEECWTNHLTDLHEMDPTQRGYGQTPFDRRQCQRDCSQYRAIEARVFDVFNFFLSTRPADLKDGVAHGDKDALVEKIESNQLIANAPTPPTLQFRKGDVDHGRAVFARSCATCHSSQSPENSGNSSYGHFVSDKLYQEEQPTPVSFFEQKRFDETIPGQSSLRIDFLSNDKLIGIDKVGTYECRARHSNHMAGHVYEQYASENYHERVNTELRGPLGLNAGQPAVLRSGDRRGPGYLRNPSLINLWATAPYFHNNALGPELAPPRGAVSDQNNLFTDSYLTPGIKGNYASYNASIESRLKVFAMSIDQLLTPSSKRPPKVSRTTEQIELDITPEFQNSLLPSFMPQFPTFKLVIPKGVPVVLLGSFRHKEFIADLYNMIKNGHVTQGSVLSEQSDVFAGLKASLIQPNAVKKINFGSVALLSKFLETYGNCVPVRNNKVSFVENMGHDFGLDTMEPADKQALKAFLLTL